MFKKLENLAKMCNENAYDALRLINKGTCLQPGHGVIILKDVGVGIVKLYVPNYDITAGIDPSCSGHAYTPIARISFYGSDFGYSGGIIVISLQGVLCKVLVYRYLREISCLISSRRTCVKCLL